jgi:hypothetical protein
MTSEKDRDQYFADEKKPFDFRFTAEVAGVFDEREPVFDRGRSAFFPRESFGGARELLQRDRRRQVFQESEPPREGVLLRTTSTGDVFFVDRRTRPEERSTRLHSAE